METLFGVAGVFGLICALVGFCVIVFNIFDSISPLQKWVRNRKELSILDRAMLQLNDAICSGVDYTICTRKNRFGNDELYVVRNDGKVIISNFDNQNGNGHYLNVEIEGKGTYRGDEFRPDVAALMHDSCLKIKQHESIALLLN